jgi:excisionase family DNA binding protein
VIVVDPLVERHLAVAVAAHVRRLRLEGRPVPHGMATLQAALSVRGGQEPSELADPGEVGDGAGMTLAFDYRDAGSLLGVSESTVARLVRDGDLDAVHIGRSARIRAEDLQEYVRNLPTSREKSNGD